MTRQVEHNAKRGMGKAPAQPLAQQSRISKAILPGIRTPGRRDHAIIGHSALLEIEQGILESTHAGQRSFRSTDNLGCVAAAHLARQHRALSAQHLRRMHRGVVPPCLLKLLSGDLQHVVFAAKLTKAHRCDRSREIRHTRHRAARSSPCRATRRLRIETEHSVHPFGFRHIAAVQRREQQVARRRKMEPVADQRRHVSP